jgi:hypothetical protein
VKKLLLMVFALLFLGTSAQAYDGYQKLWQMSGQPGPGSGYKYESAGVAASETCVAWGNSSNPCTNVVQTSCGNAYSCTYSFYFYSGMVINNIGTTANGSSGYVRSGPITIGGKTCTVRQFDYPNVRWAMCYVSKDAGGTTTWQRQFDIGNGVWVPSGGFMCLPPDPLFGVIHWICRNQSDSGAPAGTWWSAPGQLTDQGLAEPSLILNPADTQFSDWMPPNS